MEEIWKPIKGFENIYEVSNFGRVKSLERKGSVYTGKDKPRKEYIIKERIIKGWIQEYQVIELSKNNVKYSKKVHRLVAETFISNEFDKPQVNHIDENKFNNNVDNLEWTTAKENVNHGTGIARRSKSIQKQILAKKNGVEIKFNSIKEAAINFGVDPSSISHVLAGREPHVKGYTFSFL